MREPTKCEEGSPSSLINCEQSSALVLRVICDHNAYEQRQADHTTQENINVYINRVNLKKSTIKH